MLALLALTLAATPPSFDRTFSFWIGAERVGAVHARFDGRDYLYASTTVVRREKALETRSLSCRTDSQGVGTTDEGRRLNGPLPSTLALWLFAEGGPPRCIPVEDERDGHPGQVCATRHGSTLEGRLLDEPFTAALGDDGGPITISLPRQAVRFQAENGILPLPRPRDLFGAPASPGPLAALAHATSARVKASGPGCEADLSASLEAPTRDPALPHTQSHGELADIAREATRGDRTQWAAARHLTRFVDQAIASAPPELDEHDPATTWKRRKGGCVGHAAVFAALARTLGLRVRTAYGVLLEDGELQAHAWSEVEIDGRFYAVDPSRGSAPVGPDHLALARDDEPDPLRAGRCLLALPQMKWTVVPRTAAGK